MYLVKTPWWLQQIYPSLVWKKPSTNKFLYLTFDDGPHPTATPFALQTLQTYNAKATFFCIGKNVLAYPNIYQQIIKQGHTVANHTNNHVNGFKTPLNTYIQNIQAAEQYIQSPLFRPPYGRITKKQIKTILATNNPKQYTGNINQIIMWTVLSGDFDEKISKEKCLKNVVENSTAGSIIVFHDSTKAAEKMQFALPKVLDFFAAKGYMFKAL